MSAGEWSKGDGPIVSAWSCFDKLSTTRLLLPSVQAKLLPAVLLIKAVMDPVHLFGDHEGNLT